jgi:hypothetical protein
MPRNAETYYMIVFGAQRHPNWPRFSHTFAAVVRATRARPGDDPVEMQSEAIGWLPATMEIHWWNPTPEPGKNFDLRTTLDWVNRPFPAVQSKVYAWGPFQIEKRLYDAFTERVIQLNSGSVEYLAVDDLELRPDRACNCIHALSDLGLEQILLGTGAAHGREASFIVTKYFEKQQLIIDPATVYPFIRDYLQLQNEDIIYEDLD